MLDTKLKNISKAKSTGIIITVFAAAFFVAMFPVFKKEASVRKSYESTYEIYEMEDETFIQMLIQCNYALYKNVMDKNDDKIHTYEDLYMVITESPDIPGEQSGTSGTPDASGDLLESPNMGTDTIEDYTWRYQQVMGDNGVTSVLGLYASQLQEAAKICEAYVQSLGTEMDYYVLEKNTGGSIKNTSLPIENLLLSEQDGDMDNTSVIADISSRYPYYVVMDYNEYGYLQNIKVKGRDADQLLKTVRTVEGSKEGRILPEREEIEAFSVYDPDSARAAKLLTISQKKPVNATFIYAITQAQMQQDIPAYYSYYGTVDTIYTYILFGILFITMLLALCKPSLLTGKRERGLPFEVALAGVIILWRGCIELVVELVIYIAEGNLIETMDNYFLFSGLDLRIKEAAGIGFSFCILALLFGMFYFCCLELSDMIRNMKGYFRTRSLIWRFLRKIKVFFVKIYKDLETEVLNADLGDDITKLLRHLVFINFIILAIASLLWFFGIFALSVYSFALYFICKKYLFKIQTQYGKLLKAANSIAEGKLDNTFEEDFGVFGSYKKALYNIQNGFKNAVDEEVKSQKMKTELITNVSHDLKTPLTAIITYIDLLKEENITDARRKEYLDTLEKKSLRLKALIEDLFEVSKANSGNVKLDLVPVDICNLLRQAYLEQADKMEQAGLQIRFLVPEEKIILYLDSEKTYRIFENLYANIIKYALPATRVFVTLQKKRKWKKNPYRTEKHFRTGNYRKSTGFNGTFCTRRRFQKY